MSDIVVMKVAPENGADEQTGVMENSNSLNEGNIVAVKIMPENGTNEQTGHMENYTGLKEGGASVTVKVEIEDDCYDHGLTTEDDENMYCAQEDDRSLAERQNPYNTSTPASEENGRYPRDCKIPTAELSRADRRCKHCKEALQQVEARAIRGELPPGEGRHICMHCCTVFAWVGAFIYEKIHTGNSPHLCMHCGKSFKSWSEVWRHKSKVHAEERPHHCDYCGKTFEYGGALAIHRRIHTGERPYQCMHCGLTFIHTSSLITHERIHTGERPYPCERCGKAFKTGSALVSHEKSIHSDERPHKCKDCEKAFKLSSDLGIHTRNVHRGDRPHKCKYCGRAFKRPGTLYKHEKTHTRVASYQCKECEKSFKVASKLATHVKKAHGEKEKPHLCVYCGEAFEKFCSLIRHERTKHCSGYFTVPEKSVHTFERLEVHLCNRCNAAFESASLLAAHVKRKHPREEVHPGDRPQLVKVDIANHRAKMCGNKFNTNS